LEITSTQIEKKTEAWLHPWVIIIITLDVIEPFFLLLGLIGILIVCTLFLSLLCERLKCRLLTEHLHSMDKALGSIPCTAKIKIQKLNPVNQKYFAECNS
jgi:hypothetical protein